MSTLPGRIISFYRDGFRSMVLGRTLWKIILIKLIILFGFLKIFFFPDYLRLNFTTDAERADHVMANIIGDSRALPADTVIQEFSGDRMFTVQTGTAE